MATCPKCEHTGFRLEEIEISGARYRHYGVVCGACGCLITVIPLVDTNAQLNKLASELGKSLD